MLYFLSLYLAIQVISLCLLPLTTKLFSVLSDQGYAFNKSLSLLLATFTAWFLISLHIFTFTQATLIVVLLFILVIVSVFAWQSTPSSIRKYLPLPPLNLRGGSEGVIRVSRRERILYILFTEALFISVFALTAYLKYRTSPIAGTEKPMDFAIINGIFRSKYFPPNDAWYAGNTINYYYFGQYLIAFLAKLAAIPTRVIYTLALPLIFSLSALNIFGLVVNTIKKKSTALVFGLLAVTLILFGANFDTPLQIIKNLISPGSGLTPNWWDPSRVIGRGFLHDGYITITEFPYFSLLLGDVHAHVLALVLGTLFLGVCLTIFRRPTLPLVVVASLVLASLGMTNPWELPGYLLLVGLILVLFPPLKLRGGLGGVIFIGLGCLLFFTAPFLSHFVMIRAVNDPKPFISFISNVSLIGRHTLLSEYLTTWGTPSLILLICFIIIAKLKLHRSKEYSFPFLLIFLGFSLIAFCEFFFINDFFTAPYERMNTVFKLYYQSWPILWLGSLILLGQLWSKLSARRRLILIPLLSVLCVLNLTYLFSLTPVRLSEFTPASWGFDGLQYKKLGPLADQSDLAAINWFDKNVPTQVNIVESIIDPSGTGHSYNQIGRISAATGLPTVLGWYAVNHEAGWRNENPEVYLRVKDINQIYLSNNLGEVKALLSKYQIKYIYVGQMERRAYPQGNFNKFKQLGQLVWQQGTSQIYQVD